WLFIAEGDGYRLSVSNEIVRPVIEPLVRDGTVARSQRFAKLIAAHHPGFLREVDIYTDDEMRSDPLYREHSYPRGLGHAAATSGGHAAATTCGLPTHDRILISLEREKARGPVEPDAVEKLDALRSHIARSALAAARLQLERARAASATLAALGLPALVLDDK